MSRVAVIQSSYLPWKGYFDIIHDVDLFVFYDDVRYSTGGWRNRNKLKGPCGPFWITVPVASDARHHLIQDVEIVGEHWARTHWELIQTHYRDAPHFQRYRDFFEEVFTRRRWTHLTELNRFLTVQIAREFLGIETAFADSKDFEPKGAKQDRLLDLLRRCGAREYVSGPSARDYLEPQRFDEAGITLYYKDYAGYPAYRQDHGEFAHAVSILDMLFQLGPEAPAAIWGWREQEKVLGVPAAGSTAGEGPAPVDSPGSRHATSRT